MTSAANRQRYRAIANRYRRIPGEHGLRPWHVYAAVGTWSGTHHGEGTRSDVEAELLEQGQPPKVRQVKAEQVALGVGLQSGDWVVGPVTPSAGTAWSTLCASFVDGEESFRLRLWHEETGQDMQCVVVSITDDRALRTMITVRPVSGAGEA